MFADTMPVRTLALKKGEMVEHFLMGEKGQEAMRFSAVQPSVVMKAARVDPLPIYKIVENDEGERAFVVDQKVKIPSGAKGVLLLGWPVGGKNHYVAIADDFVGAGFDDWLLINASKKPIAFKVGDQTKPIRLMPGSSEKYRIRENKGRGAAVLAQAEIKGKVKTFYSTYWAVQPGKRVMALFVDDGEKIRVKRISDKLAPPKEEVGAE